ncbi:MAG: hypothetical protein P794_03060 [Epsilonproteobacteria bacterium (ex Lamellibrachia satsuma)]|nr:MAG: hypothetical protein P794_03060 [Epsilonproteobacteria bacterium (ex Lamellibrachia satsuma)]
MTIWKYEESKDMHRLVKFYKENHGEGEYMGDLDEQTIKKMILEIKPDIEVNQAYGTLSYFGMLPLLVIVKKQ